MRSVNLAEKFRQFNEHWSPKIVGELNDCYVKLVKLKGEFVWHHHEVEDELFLVVKGRLLLKFRDREVWVGEGEFVSRGGSSTCPSRPTRPTCSCSSRSPHSTRGTSAMSGPSASSSGSKRPLRSLVGRR